MPNTESPLNRLIGEVLARRDQDTRFRANVARGLYPIHERYAYPWVLPLVTDERDQTLFLRVAGLIASFPEIPHSDKFSLGGSFRQLSIRKSPNGQIEPDKPDPIASRLITLEEEDFEGAIDVFRRLLELNNKERVPVNYFKLGRRLQYWGDGQSETSQDVRRKTLGEYYGAWAN